MVRVGLEGGRLMVRVGLEGGRLIDEDMIRSEREDAVSY